MFYITRIPKWLTLFWPKRIWYKKDAPNKTVYLTFDDGPHPTITLFVLEMLEKYNCKGSFFCVGENVKKYPEIYNLIQNKGHAIGNHTFNHLNSNKTSTKNYLSNYLKAKEYIKSNLFRPPYGKLKSKHFKALNKKNDNIETIMWSNLSADFDQTKDYRACFENATKKLVNGSIIVFHDSEKAFKNLEHSLPLTLQYLNDNNWKTDIL